MLAGICTAHCQLDRPLVVEWRSDDPRADQALSTILANAERLSKQITVVALAVAIPLHLYIDPVAGFTVRAAALVAFAASSFSTKRWRRTPAVVATAAAIAPVFLAAITGTAA